MQGKEKLFDLGWIQTQVTLTRATQYLSGFLPAQKFPLQIEIIL